MAKRSSQTAAALWPVAAVSGGGPLRSGSPLRILWMHNVRYWHLADIPSCTAHVRFWHKADISTCHLMLGAARARPKLIPRVIFTRQYGPKGNVV